MQGHHCVDRGLRADSGYLLRLERRRCFIEINPLGKFDVYFVVVAECQNSVQERARKNVK